MRSLSGKRVLVTGGAGFIGSELVRQLADAGAAVTVVDNLVNGSRDNLADLPHDRVQLAVADVRDVARLSSLLAGVDLVFHLACLGVRHSLHAPAENHEVNATATLGLLGLGRAAGVSRFVYVSSSEVYGTALWAPMSEDHPTRPTTVYGSSKLAGECYTRAYHSTYGFPAVIIRPFNTYGPRCHHEGDSGEVIPKFVLRCLAGRPLVVFGDGSQTRDFTYVSDTAAGILAAGLADEAIGQTINLGSGREITIADLARRVADATGRHSAEVVHDVPRPADVLRLCAETSRAARLLGFRSHVSLTEGLERLVRWYLGRGRSPEELLESEIVHNWAPRRETHADRPEAVTV